MNKRNFVAWTRITRLFFLLFCGVSLVVATQLAQAANPPAQRIPTTAQVAMQKKPVNRKGVRRGTTSTDRWAAAIKKADHRAAHIRAGQKGVK